MIGDAISWFLALGVAAFLIAGTLAPLETMSWWAGHQTPKSHFRVGRAERPKRRVSHYIIYLGGIDSVDGDDHTEYERPLLQALERKVGETAVIRSVFPYAASGEALLQGPRIFRWLWRRLRNMRRTRPSWLTSLINARNFFQLLVSADRRYGPIFNAALASLIFEALAQAGWRANDQAHRLSLVGYSGGVQMAIGAAPYLALHWRGPIGIVSIGGTIIASDGLDYVDRLDHLTGAADLALRLAPLMCVSRWPIALRSSWRRAESGGRIHIVKLGRIGHTGSRGYLGRVGSAHATANFGATFAATLACLRRPLTPRAPRARGGRAHRGAPALAKSGAPDRL